MIKPRRIKSDQDGNDVAPKKEKKHCQGVQEMALSRAVGNESSIANCFSFSSVSGDANTCHQQYARLKTFLSEAVEPYKTELLPLLYPLFIHVYLEMLCGGHKTSAHKFYSRYHLAFRSDKVHNSVLNDLQKMFNKEDVTVCKEVNEFRENKYNYVLSEESFHYLFRYLKTEESILLLQVFNKHFDIRVGEAENTLDPQQTDEKSNDQMALASPPCTPENKVIHNEVSLSSLQQCIKKVRSGPPCLPSICLYTMDTLPHGLCSVDLLPDLSRLLTGYDDSSIRLWSLTPEKLQTEPCHMNTSQIHISRDYYQDVAKKNNSHVGDEDEVKTMRGHCGAVYGTKFTSDRQYVLSASEDTTVRLWDLSTHTSRCVYRGHNYPIWALDTSPVGGYFVTCSHDRLAKLWTMDRVYPLRNFIGHTSDVDCVRFHPNCSYIATGGSDRVVRLWSVHDAQAVRLFQGHKSGVYALAFSHNGKILASAGEDRRIKLWDLNTGSLLKDLKGHMDTIYSLSFNPQSTILASGGLDGTIRLWNIEEAISPPGHSMQGSSPQSSLEVCSPELLGCYPVKSTTIHHLHYSSRNLLIAVGAS